MQQALLRVHKLHRLFKDHELHIYYLLLNALETCCDACIWNIQLQPGSFAVVLKEALGSWARNLLPVYVSAVQYYSVAKIMAIWCKFKVTRFQPGREPWHQVPDEIRLQMQVGWHTFQLKRKHCVSSLALIFLCIFLLFFSTGFHLFFIPAGPLLSCGLLQSSPDWSTCSAAASLLSLLTLGLQWADRTRSVSPWTLSLATSPAAPAKLSAAALELHRLTLRPVHPKKNKKTWTSSEQNAAAAFF